MPEMMEGEFFIAWTCEHFAISTEHDDAIKALESNYKGDLPPYRVARVPVHLPPVEYVEQAPILEFKAPSRPALRLIE